MSSSLSFSILVFFASLPWSIESIVNMLLILPCLPSPFPLSTHLPPLHSPFLPLPPAFASIVLPFYGIARQSAHTVSVNLSSCNPFCFPVSQSISLLSVCISCAIDLVWLVLVCLCIYRVAVSHAFPYLPPFPLPLSNFPSSFLCLISVSISQFFVPPI